MRIGVLTLNLNYNYGGILQAYALTTVLGQYGHEVILVQRKRHFSLWMNIRRFIGLLLNRESSFFENIQSLETRKFINKNIPKCTERLSDKQLRCFCDSQRMDAMVVGSDQIWRRWRRMYDYSAFLDFCVDYPHLKRIAYGVSFGLEQWQYSPSETKQIKDLVSIYDSVSVREQSGILLCRQYLDVKAQWVLDPTMLLDTKIYMSLITEKLCSKGKQELVSYFLGSKSTNELMARIYAEEHEMKYRSLSVKSPANIVNVLSNISRCIWPPVEEWLSGIINADIVVTDSFHGTVFAILFHRPFVVISNDERGNARLVSLLNMFEMDNLIFNLNDKIKEIKKENYDWKKVDAIIKDMKEKSLHFLKENLQ